MRSWSGLILKGLPSEHHQTGLEALSLAASESPNLVILDLMLPQMDGLEVCKALRHKPEPALVPIIMLTAKREESDTVIGIELGADDYSPKTLVARVKPSSVDWRGHTIKSQRP